mmetsp:Transcript_44031/g.104248  ORF Transcript_44031/g.104248 Transcript_44031/m.104248 type:complete len:252 (-) Transcript_44031:1159-1914(-)
MPSTTKEAAKTLFPKIGRPLFGHTPPDGHVLHTCCGFVLSYTNCPIGHWAHSWFSYPFSVTMRWPTGHASSQYSSGRSGLFAPHLAPKISRARFVRIPMPLHSAPLGHGLHLYLSGSTTYSAVPQKSPGVGHVRHGLHCCPSWLNVPVAVPSVELIRVVPAGQFVRNQKSSEFRTHVPKIGWAAEGHLRSGLASAQARLSASLQVAPSGHVLQIGVVPARSTLYRLAEQLQASTTVFPVPLVVAHLGHALH